MPGGRKAIAGKKTITTAERRRDAVELRKQGLSLDAIAAQLGYANASGAYKAIMAALAQTLREPADELRTLECERLDIMLHALWPKVVKGDTWAIDRALAIMDRRAKLLGLDAPLKREDTLRVIMEQAAAAAADEFGLDPDEVLADAMAIVAKAGR